MVEMSGKNFPYINISRFPTFKRPDHPGMDSDLP